MHLRRSSLDRIEHFEGNGRFEVLLGVFVLAVEPREGANIEVCLIQPASIDIFTRMQRRLQGSF